MHNQQRPPEPHLKTNTIHKDVYITISGVLLNTPKTFSTLRSLHGADIQGRATRLPHRCIRGGNSQFRCCAYQCFTQDLPQENAARALRKVLKENWRDRHGLANFFSDIAVQHSRYNETHTFTSQSSRTNT